MRRLIVVVVGLAILAAFVFAARRQIRATALRADSELQTLTTISAAALADADRERQLATLDELILHRSIAAATLVTRDGERLARRRPISSGGALPAELLPPSAAICRSTPGGTLCVEPDRGAIRQEAARLLWPYAATLPLALLLGVLAWRGGGHDPESLAAITATVEQATREQAYSGRVIASDDSTVALVGAINTLFEQMQNRDLMLRRRSTELEAVNKELESFSFSVSHDLRAPLASIDGFSRALVDYCSDQLDDEAREYLDWIRDGSRQMQQLVEALLQMSRLNQQDLIRTDVNLSALVEEIAAGLQQSEPDRSAEFQIAPNVRAPGDERLLRAVLENMLSNAWKFTRKKEHAKIEFGSMPGEESQIFFVRDNGAGFDSTYAASMFNAFQRLHSRDEFDGTGIGLATVKRVIERHGGTVWAEGEVGHGATFYFTVSDRRQSAVRRGSSDRMSA